MKRRIDQSMIRPMCWVELEGLKESPVLLIPAPVIRPTPRSPPSQYDACYGSSRRRRSGWEDVDGLIQESMSKRKMTPGAKWKRNLSATQRHVACRIALHVDRTAIICREDKRRVFPHVCPLERIHNLDIDPSQYMTCNIA
jgi:hypothetical protein